MSDTEQLDADSDREKHSDRVWRFQKNGYIGPIDLLNQTTCRRVTEQLKRQPIRAAEWDKGCAVYSRTVYEMACLPQILSLLSHLISGPIMLWGASLVLRVPGQRHDWHTDIETGQNDGQTVSVWIGLEGTNRGSGLQLMAGSHLFGQPIQAEANRLGVSLSDACQADIEDWAKTYSPEARIRQPDITDGQAIVFDGRLWHGSVNHNAYFSRRALLLQYASPSVPIRRPDPNNLKWPFQQIEHPRPPAIMVAGSGKDDMNKLVPAPPNSGNWQGPQITTVIHPLPNPLAEESEAGWRSHHVMHGQTSQVPHLGCHVSVLSPGKTPHPPHRHSEEEILFVLDGSAEVTIVDEADGSTSRRSLRENCFTYYPSDGVRHTLTNKSSKPVTYLMFKWRAAPSGKSDDYSPCEILDANNAFNEMPDSNSLFASQSVFDGSTQYLRKLHSHVSVVKPGGGYAEHIDAHDVAILLLSGEVETLNQTVKAPSLIFYAGGQKHGLSNPGQADARYVVFEFHGHLNGTLLPTRLDGPTVKAWIKQSIRVAMSRSTLLEAIIRKVFGFFRR
ncbi:MAG: cupin domain-containing protein [Burkholderiaceae bacterium]